MDGDITSTGMGINASNIISSNGIAITVSGIDGRGGGLNVLEDISSTTGIGIEIGGSITSEGNGIDVGGNIVSDEGTGIYIGSNITANKTAINVGENILNSTNAIHVAGDINS